MEVVPVRIGALDPKAAAGMMLATPPHPLTMGRRQRRRISR
jgi:hypothetical protein